MPRQERASLAQRNVESSWLRESEIKWLRLGKEAGADHLSSFLSSLVPQFPQLQNELL